MKKQKMNTNRMVMLSMFVAVGVVISPILRVEGMCPTAHLVNIVCAVFLGPWYSLLCATMIGVIRMLFMGIPPLALTGAVFGAFLSGVFYRASHGKIFCAVFGEIFGTGIIGSLVSYPVMAFLMGRDGLNAFFYTPMFLGATCMGGAVAWLLLTAQQKWSACKNSMESWSEMYMTKEMLRKIAAKIAVLGEQIRQHRPLVHCITNPIAIHDSANIVLAAGGRPIMAEHPQEVEEIVRTAQVLVLNLGNITDVRMSSMKKAFQEALKNRVPTVLDLVGTSAAVFDCIMPKNY